MSTLLYIRGEPGAGKITVGRLLEQSLGWPLLWFHDFDFLRNVIDTREVEDTIGNVVCESLSKLMSTGKSVIYIRPSRTWATVERVKALAEKHGHRFVLVGLTAKYFELCERVQRRDDEHRITTREGLDEYLSRPECYEFPGQHIIDTTMLKPADVAEAIKNLL